jgi:hypothetical protein
MQVTQARNHAHCTELLALPQGSLCRLNKGEHQDLKVSTLVHIREKTGVSLDTLADWFRMPADRVLGRVTAEQVTLNGRRRVSVQYETGSVRLSQLILLAGACFCAFAAWDNDSAMALLHRVVTFIIN